MQIDNERDNTDQRVRCARKHNYAYTQCRQRPTPAKRAMECKHDPKDADRLDGEPYLASQAEPQGYRAKTKGYGDEKIFKRQAISDTAHTHHLKRPKQENDIQGSKRPGKPDITELSTQNGNEWDHQQRWQRGIDDIDLATDKNRIVNMHCRYLNDHAAMPVPVELNYYHQH